MHVELQLPRETLAKSSSPAGSWDTGGSAHQYHFVDLALRHLRVFHHLLYGSQTLLEVVLVHVLEPGARDGVEVDALEERVDLDVCLGRRRERTLRALARRAQTSQCAAVGAHVLAELTLELLKIVDIDDQKRTNVVKR